MPGITIEKSVKEKKKKRNGMKFEYENQEDTNYGIETMTRQRDTGDPIDNEGVFPNEAIEDPINPRIINTWQSRCVNPAGGWLASNRDPGIIYTRTPLRSHRNL